MDIRHDPDRAELIDIWQAELDTIADLADGLSDEQWAAPTSCPGWSVADLVAHTIDIEQVLAGDPRPEHEPDWSALPHATGDVGIFTELGVDWRRGRPQSDVVAELRTTVLSRRAALDVVPVDGEVLSPMGRPTTVERLMRLRILDAWVHEQDIRSAVGLPGGMDSSAAIVTLQQFIAGLPKVWAKQTKAPAGSVVHLVIADVDRGVEAWAMVDDDAQGRLCDPVEEPTVALTLTWGDFLLLSAGREPGSSVLGRVNLAGDLDRGRRLLDAMTQTP